MLRTVLHCAELYCAELHSTALQRLLWLKGDGKLTLLATPHESSETSFTDGLHGLHWLQNCIDCSGFMFPWISVIALIARFHELHWLQHCIDCCDCMVYCFWCLVCGWMAASLSLQPYMGRREVEIYCTLHCTTLYTALHNTVHYTVHCTLFTTLHCTLHTVLHTTVDSRL